MRWRPKEWMRPRSQRARDVIRSVPVYEILRDLYPFPGNRVMRRPVWATLAYERNWIGAEDYYAIPREWTGEYARDLELLHDSAPLLALIRKDATFGEGQP